MIYSKRNKLKVFCIGQNKTGTTTIEHALKEFGYNLGDQKDGEKLFENWIKRDFNSIINFTKKSNAFQDIPFSLPYTYQVLDQYYPNSKFILTLRDSDNQWYNSITQFHKKLWSKNEYLPSLEDLKNADYNYEGFAYDYLREVYGVDDNDLYNEEKLKYWYNQYNNDIIRYFKNSNKLLVVNVAINKDYDRLCNFLNKQKLRNGFEWKNKTKS